MATELAKAYVQIIPSAKGIKGGIEKSLGNEADVAGASTGNKLAGTIKRVIATAAIGKALAATISQGAELEQSIGGIETLFKGSAEKVKQNAADAYRTAGMSANEYMQLTTSFSASLLQSLSGNTAKAADVSNMAMTDMSDNANKMGTNMEDIKNAYQGFAKQNYTMLDNLKLGYGGTKTEMERLLADAQKITGVKYDVNNLSDVYSAIHVIQGELDITGTTAKEAASTISGSFASMKAAFQNVLGQLTLGMDVAPALNALADTVVTFVAGNLLPAVWNILSALPGALVTFIQALAPQVIGAIKNLAFQISNEMANASQLTKSAGSIVQQMVTGIMTEAPKLLASAQKMLEQILQGISANLPQVLQEGITIVTNIANGILQNLPALINAAANLIISFSTKVLSMLPTILAAGAKLLLNLVNGIIKNLPQIIAAAASAITKFLSSIGQKLPQILQQGIKIIGQLAVGLIKAIPTLVGKVPEIIKAIRNAFSNVDWGSIGLNIIKGIANGLKGAASMIWDAVKGVLGNFKDKVLSFFGIHSPSRWGEWVGEMLDLGLANGILGNATPITNAVDGLLDTISNPFSKSMNMEYAVNGGGYNNSDNNLILGRLNALVVLMQAIADRDEEIILKLNNREVGRGLKEMGVVFADGN